MEFAALDQRVLNFPFGPAMADIRSDVSPRYIPGKGFGVYVHDGADAAYFVRELPALEAAPVPTVAPLEAQEIVPISSGQLNLSAPTLPASSGSVNPGTFIGTYLAARSTYLPLPVPNGRSLNLPTNNGSWTGAPGNFTWRSTLPSINGVTGGAGIPYRNGLVDLGKWSVFTVNVPGMTGLRGDDYKAFRALKNAAGFESVQAARRWVTERGLTPHHAANGAQTQFVPREFHRQLSYTGGAFTLRNWPHAGVSPTQRLSINAISAGGRYLGAAGMAYGAYQDGTSLYREFTISQATGNYDNTYWEVGRVAGGWTAAAAGGAAGAKVGAVIGAFGGP